MIPPRVTRALVASVLAALALAPAGVAAIAPVVESDGGTVCGFHSQGTVLYLPWGDKLYCSNSGDPFNGPFHWIYL